MISRACLIGAYQKKLEEIARSPDVELMVVVPPSWREAKRVIGLERAHTQGYQLVVEPIAFNGSFHLHFYPRLRRRLQAFSPDILHADEEPYNLATFQALRLASHLGCARLWFSWQNLNRRYPLPFRLMEAYNLRHVDYAIVGSSGSARVWRDKGYSGPLAVIPQFGVAPELYWPGSRRNDAARGFVIGYVGRLVQEKGIDLLLEALAQLQGSWRLVIAGGGPQRTSLERMAQQLGISEHVVFDGWLPASRVPALYQQLDALVLPSRSRPNWVEQFGRVLIEAMASGVPVIGSDCGEIPSVIGDAGLVFPEGDVAALRAHIERLMRNGELRLHLRERGREHVLEHYTQASVAAETVRVYREMLSPPCFE
jgi:glycosyltransferase involved in cell wall biosynthesis